MRAALTLLSRSVWKGMSRPKIHALATSLTPPSAGPNIVPFEINAAVAPNKHPPIRTQRRAATITPQLVGYRFSVHNGKLYQEVYITEEMVGRKLGEFVPTRKRFSYKMTKNK
jgi:ribosomal protein S19